MAGGSGLARLRHLPRYRAGPAGDLGPHGNLVVLVRWVGRGKASGAQGEISMAMVWTVREQAITRIEFFLDRAEALEAVGLRE